MRSIGKHRVGGYQGFVFNGLGTISRKVQVDPIMGFERLCLASENGLLGCNGGSNIYNRCGQWNEKNSWSGCLSTQMLQNSVKHPIKLLDLKRCLSPLQPTWAPISGPCLGPLKLIFSGPLNIISPTVNKETLTWNLLTHASSPARKFGDVLLVKTWNLEDLIQHRACTSCWERRWLQDLPVKEMPVSDCNMYDCSSQPFNPWSSKMLKK